MKMSDEPQVGQEQTEDGQEPQGQEPQAELARSEPDEHVETFDREYVEALRKEAAGYRTRAAQAEERAAKLAKEAEERARQAEEQAAALETKVAELTVNQALYLQAVRMGFYDPEDAVRLADKDRIKVEDGKVSGVDEVLKELAAAKPHLLKGRGTRDAAASGSAISADINEMIRRKAGRVG